MTALLATDPTKPSPTIGAGHMGTSLRFLYPDFASRTKSTDFLVDVTVEPPTRSTTTLLRMPV